MSRSERDMREPLFSPSTLGSGRGNVGSPSTLGLGRGNVGSPSASVYSPSYRGNSSGAVGGGSTVADPNVSMTTDQFSQLLQQMVQLSERVGNSRDRNRSRERREDRERELERERQREEKERLREEREINREYDRVINSLTRFTEGDLVRYIRSLESQLEEREVPQELWRRALLSRLPSEVLDRASSAIENTVEYLELKDEIVSNYGKSLRTVGAQMFPRRPPVVKDRRELAKFVVDEVRRVSSFCTTISQWECFIAQTYLGSMVTGTEVATVFSRKVNELRDIISIGTTLNEVVGGEESSHLRYQPFTRSRPSGDSNNDSGREIRCFSCRKLGHRASECPERKGRSRDNHNAGNGGKPRKVHKVSHCEEGFSVEGSVNGIPCRIVPDTGAQITVVPDSLVADGQYTGERVQLEGLTPARVEAKIAIVPVGHRGQVYKVRCAATDQMATEQVLFSVQLNEDRASNLLAEAARAACVTHTPCNKSCNSVGVVTRNMSRKLREAEKLDESRALEAALSELGGCKGAESDAHMKSDVRTNAGLHAKSSSDSLSDIHSNLSGGEECETHLESGVPSVPETKSRQDVVTPVSGRNPSKRRRKSRRKSRNDQPGKGADRAHDRGVVRVTERSDEGVATVPSEGCGKAVERGSVSSGVSECISGVATPATPEGSTAVQEEAEARNSPPPSESKSADNSSALENQQSSALTPAVVGEGGESSISGCARGTMSVSESEKVGALVHGVPEELNLTVPTGKGEGSTAFISKQLSDESLKDYWVLGKDTNRGYEVRDGLLVHVLEGEVHGEEMVRIVVPKCERQRLLTLVHEKGGHLATRKCREILNRLFTWPGMGKEITAHIARCDVCARVNKSGNRAPKLEERPVVGEPFRVVALDIVGPLPKGRGGAVFLLTYTCMATRWPEAVPLRTASANEVAEAFVSIVTRTGLPDTVLTDKGSVFTSKTFKMVTDLFGCGLIHTTPYHPQGNGVLERLHGTLKPMLAKAADKGIDWVRFTPLALFALRQMPHTDSGYSPFDLVYGFQIRGPLDLVYAGWTDDVCKDVNVTKWIEALRERISALTDLSVARRKRAKGKQIERLNVTRSDRKLSKGDVVYMRIPGRQGAFKASWEGPFTVEEVLSRVNYRLVGNGLPARGRVVHLNNIKLTHTEVAKVYRACVAEHDERLDEKPKRLSEEKCHGYSEAELEDVLDRNGRVFSDSPGLFTGYGVKLSVKEGVEPINQPVRRVPFALRDGVRTAIDKLVVDGVIERADGSQWCSPIVPVKKPDGSVRICVDYRALNDVTPQVRHHMPTLEELLDEIGDSAVLSTIDLTAGFHQIELELSCRDLTTFVCPEGKFRYRRLPFGHKNAPATFQSMVDGVLRDVNHCVGYIDDILVYSSSWEEHLVDLDRLFSVLFGRGLCVKRGKCCFGRVRVLYLGHLVGCGRLSIPEERVKAVKDWPRPTVKRQLKTFLGTIGYYRKFVIIMETRNKDGPLDNRVANSIDKIETLRRM